MEEMGISRAGGKPQSHDAGKLVSRPDLCQFADSMQKIDRFIEGEILGQPADALPDRHQTGMD